MSNDLAERKPKEKKVLITCLMVIAVVLIVLNLFVFFVYRQNNGQADLDECIKNAKKLEYKIERHMSRFIFLADTKASLICSFLVHLQPNHGQKTSSLLIGHYRYC